MLSKNITVKGGMDMSLETIESFAKESNNEELLNAVSSIKESQSQNVSRINSLEVDLQKAIDKRDRQASLVKSTFGVDEISEESLSKAKQVTGEPDATLRAENEKLVTMAEMLKAEKESVSSKYQETVNRYKIEKNLNGLGAMAETENAKAYDILLNEVTNGVDFDEDGNVVFKANDGTTVRNSDGSPMSLADRYNQLKDSDEFQFLFKQKRAKSGSGSQGGKSSGAKVTSLKGLNDVERTRLYKQDPELFKSLLNKE